MILTETAAFGIGWGGNVVEGKFPLLEWRGGSKSRGSFLTVLGGMEPALIQIMPADGVEANAFLAQWDFAMTLLHPYLAKIWGAGRSVINGRELVYVVTEAFDASLATVFQKQTMPPEDVRDLFNPVLSALSHLHKNGVVHGHITPSSIVFAGRKPKLAVTDLLIAGSGKSGAADVGPYDAPEFRQGVVTAAADVWSVGMTMYEVMTRAASSPDTERDAAGAMPSLPSPFREIVLDCLQVDPQRRCSIDSILERLNEGDFAPAPEKHRPADIREEIGAAAEPKTTEVATGHEVAERLANKQEAEHSLNKQEAERPAIKARGEEESSQSVYFSPSLGRFEEAHLTRFRFTPHLAVLIVVIVLFAVMIAGGYRKTSFGAGNQISGSAARDTAQKSDPATPPAEPQSEQANSPPAAEDEAQSTTSQSEPSKEVDTAQPLPDSAPAADQTAASVDTDGAVAQRVMPDVSQGAFAGTHATVEVTIRVWVNKAGTVTNAAYVSPGPGNYFARAAQRAALSWQFTPPTRNGEPEASAWILQFSFARNKTDVTARRAIE